MTIQFNKIRPYGPVRMFINRHEYYLCRANGELVEDGVMRFTNVKGFQLTSDRLQRMKRFRNKTGRRKVRYENEKLGD